jgi:hypothetical protein
MVNYLELKAIVTVFQSRSRSWSGAALASFLTALGLIGCNGTHVDVSDPGSTLIERGRLKYGKNLSALRIGDHYLFRA